MDDLSLKLLPSTAIPSTFFTLSFNRICTFLQLVCFTELLGATFQHGSLFTKALRPARTISRVRCLLVYNLCLGGWIPYCWVGQLIFLSHQLKWNHIYNSYNSLVNCSYKDQGRYGKDYKSKSVQVEMLHRKRKFSVMWWYQWLLWGAAAAAAAAAVAAVVLRDTLWFEISFMDITVSVLTVYKMAWLLLWFLLIVAKLKYKNLIGIVCISSRHADMYLCNQVNLLGVIDISNFVCHFIISG